MEPTDSGIPDTDPMVSVDRLERPPTSGAEPPGPVRPPIAIESPAGALENEPTVVEVYYGTNRKRLTPSFLSYATPFIGSGVLIALLFVVPALIRRFLKVEHQSRPIWWINGLIVVALVYTIPVGFQNAIQRWQLNESLDVQYGSERREKLTEGRRFEVGICKVSIPPGHVTGQVEVPEIMHFEFAFDPTRHFVLAEINPHTNQAFFDKLRQRVNQAPERNLFVFVHGFHNTFQDAAFRTAQIAHDMKFPGAPVFFSWPSQGKVLDYVTDANNVGEAIQHLVEFLDQLRAESGAERIHVIAHSMGSRALTAAVKEIGNRNAGTPVFNEMILAAPDIDAGLFRNMAPALTAATDRVTLYASTKDQALLASRRVHGGTYLRAGEIQDDGVGTPVIVSPVESVDVSNVTGGHSYIADSGRILDDVRNILLYQRVLTEDIAESRLDQNNQKYWVLKASQ